MCVSRGLSSRPASLHLQRDVIEADYVTLFVQSRTPLGTCPECQNTASRIHSRSTRTLADLPWESRAARMLVQARRFFGTATGCPRKTLAESRLAPARRRSVRTSLAPGVGQASGRIVDSSSAAYSSAISAGWWSCDSPRVRRLNQIPIHNFRCSRSRQGEVKCFGPSLHRLAESTPELAMVLSPMLRRTPRRHAGR